MREALKPGVRSPATRELGFVLQTAGEALEKQPRVGLVCWESGEEWEMPNPLRTESSGLNKPIRPFNSLP